ncbi:carboxypeptidase-like regulatory domain-containing protein [Nocardioides daejeonensis]|uniref:carboxypeptidase-like regulatory domain-containing protein n=1 Tax=Nocardioides daejeonensis TaxID=1046556 RepID=UPI000D74263F|nr:carboxypeptidase-like regulatory domain-containing protein [Nocardioides daejeonensis]
MNDQILSDLLERSVNNVPASQVPISDILRTGSAIRRRRRGATVLVGAVVLSVTAVGAVVAGQNGQRDARVADQITTPPTPPAGTKWVGVGRDVVAIPKEWPVVPGVYCQGPSEPYATITQWHVTVGCTPLQDSKQARASVDIEGNASGGFTTQLDGDAGSGGPTQRALDASRTTLPEGWIAIPSGEPYGRAGLPSVTSEVAALRAAGFDVVLKHVPADVQWQRVTTEPEIGTPAQAGSTVTVYDHGAVASSSTLKGSLEWVGGPAPGSAVPHPGIIHVVSSDDSVDETAQADADGSWDIRLPPGQYTVRATSPGYLSARGVSDACSAIGPVTVRADHVLNVKVYCQLH